MRIFLLTVSLQIATALVGCQLPAQAQPDSSCHSQTPAASSQALTIFSEPDQKDTDVRALLRNDSRIGYFRNIPANSTWHWYRNLLSPEYCRMVLCNGSCAYRGGARHGACTLLPLFPLLKNSSLQFNPGCNM